MTPGDRMLLAGRGESAGGVPRDDLAARAKVWLGILPKYPSRGSVRTWRYSVSQISRGHARGVVKPCIFGRRGHLRQMPVPSVDKVKGLVNSPYLFGVVAHCQAFGTQLSHPAHTAHRRGFDSLAARFTTKEYLGILGKIILFFESHRTILDTYGTRGIWSARRPHRPSLVNLSRSAALRGGRASFRRGWL